MNKVRACITALPGLSLAGKQCASMRACTLPCFWERQIVHISIVALATPQPTRMWKVAVHEFRNGNMSGRHMAATLQLRRKEGNGRTGMSPAATQLARAVSARFGTQEWEVLAEAELLQTVDVPIPARPLTPEQVQAATHSTSVQMRLASSGLRQRGRACLLSWTLPLR